MLSNTYLKYLTVGLALSGLTACDNEPLVIDANTSTDENGNITIDITDVNSESTAVDSQPVLKDNNPSQSDDIINSEDSIPDVSIKEEMPAISGTGKFIQSVYNENLCLGTTLISETVQVTMQACDLSDDQRWHIEESGKIINALSIDTCLGFTELNAYSSLSLQDCSENNSHWKVEGALIIQQDLAIDIDRADDSVIAYPIHGGENQQWIIGETLKEVISVEEDPIIDDENSANETEETPDDNGSTTDTSDANPTEEVDESADQSDSSAFIRLHSDAQWTFLAMEVGMEYGKQTISVPAAQNWVNTGLHLTTGQSVSISATGQWQVARGTELHGPDGTGVIIERGCTRGSLVARTGLFYDDEDITCIGSNGVFTASKSGIVFISGIVGNDLGEVYETRNEANGELQVTLESSGQRVPTIKAQDAANYDYQQVSSGWVEILGDHNIVTLPTDVASADAHDLFDALTRLDDIYRAHTELRGATPQHGQPIRWFADTEDAPGWMLAGNPVRLDPRLVNSDIDERITIAGKADSNNWGYAHELGHDFNFVDGDWYYTMSGGLEAWPNVFTLHALDTLNLPLGDQQCVTRKSEYLSYGTYENDLKKDVWLSLCFLLEFKDQYGWQFYKNFYQEFNETPGHGWSFLRTRFSSAAGEDVNAIFDEWKIPSS